MTEPIPPAAPNPSSDETSDDRLLLGRTAAGDKEAFRAFYSRHGARVMAMVSRRVWDPQLAEDLVQDIFVAAWLSASGYRPELGEPETWLLGIARHKLLDHWRRLRRIGAVLGRNLGALGETPPVPDSDLRVSLELALAALTRDQRRVIDLIYLSGLTFSEAARALDVPVGTVKSRVNAALERMRTSLKGSQ